MRSTIVVIDPLVLKAARRQARKEKKTLSQFVTHLLRRFLRRQ